MGKYIKGQILIPQSEMAKMLSISVGKLIELRKQGTIPFVPLGCRILYEKSAVMKALSELQIN